VLPKVSEPMFNAEGIEVIEVCVPSKKVATSVLPDPPADPGAAPPTQLLPVVQTPVPVVFQVCDAAHVLEVAPRISVRQSASGKIGIPDFRKYATG